MADTSRDWYFEDATVEAAIRADEERHYSVGWHHDANGWWYADSAESYYRSGWQTINRHRYYFNPDGYAVTGWQELGGKWYYFEPRAGHELECALYVTDQSGVQAPGMF